MCLTFVDSKPLSSFHDNHQSPSTDGGLCLDIPGQPLDVTLSKLLTSYDLLLFCTTGIVKVFTADVVHQCRILFLVPSKLTL